EQGTSSLVFLMAMLSINLGVLNLLPIPILDGGHLLFFFIEAIRRKPLEDRQRELAQQVGLVLLVGIMIFAFWNDIERLISP
ncbi:MAG TPA: RIP metalloprotease RseP, partial [Nitrospira sp.]|nr:RIP metalloprotease RseP [Nitrospira sp.]